MSQVILKTTNLSCGYDDKVILNNLNLEINQGEIVGVIGPNGCGKTTLIRSITGILKPKQGGVFFYDKDIAEMPLRDFARQVAVVSQSTEIASSTVEEFVLLGRIPHMGRFQFLEKDKDLEIAAQSMRITDSYRLKNRLMGQMSGGERQLALVARALTQQPKLLLLDEPTTHLDITHQVALLDLLRKLNKQLGLTVIMVLHDLNLASEYCDKLVLLDQGLIHKMGSPEEVLDYKIIEDVYKTTVVVEKNPFSKKPYVLLVSQQEIEKRKAKTAGNPKS